jgi:hypothetical protein
MKVDDKDIIAIIETEMLRREIIESEPAKKAYAKVKNYYKKLEKQNNNQSKNNNDDAPADNNREADESNVENKDTTL